MAEHSKAKQCARPYRPESVGARREHTETRKYQEVDDQHADFELQPAAARVTRQGEVGPTTGQGVARRCNPIRRAADRKGVGRANREESDEIIIHETSVRPSRESASSPARKTPKAKAIAIMIAKIQASLCSGLRSAGVTPRSGSGHRADGRGGPASNTSCSSRIARAGCAAFSFAARIRAAARRSLTPKIRIAVFTYWSTVPGSTPSCLAISLDDICA